MLSNYDNHLLSGLDDGCSNEFCPLENICKECTEYLDCFMDFIFNDYDLCSECEEYIGCKFIKSFKIEMTKSSTLKTQLEESDINE